MAAVEISTFLNRGQQYTFSFAQGGLNPIRKGAADVTEALQYLSGVSQLSVALVGGVMGLFANQYDVTFTYVGDGSDTVANLVQNMLDALDSTFYTFDFLGANSGGGGVTPNDAAATNTNDLASGFGLTSSSLWAIAIVALAVVFVMSGGASASRRILE
jgi:hypothetical protein